MSFQILGSQESNALNGARFGVETKKLWSFEDKPRNHASKEESPLTEITHTKPLTPFLTSLKPSEPIALVEETMPPKEIIRTEVKVLIQPTQEATTDASAPKDPTIT